MQTVESESSYTDEADFLIVDESENVRHILTCVRGIKILINRIKYYRKEFGYTNVKGERL